MKRKIEVILVKGAIGNHESVFKKESYDSYYKDDDEYIALSKPVMVEFDLLDNEAVTSKEIAAIDKAINSEMASSESRLNNLKQKKQELLAIGNES